MPEVAKRNFLGPDNWNSLKRTKSDRSQEGNCREVGPRKEWGIMGEGTNEDRVY